MNTKYNNKLGIIAGKGALPNLVIQQAEHIGINPVIIFFKENSVGIDNSKYINLETNFGKIGQILDFFKFNNVENIIFAGAILRPSFSNISFDSTGIKWMQKLGMKAFAGDDALLKGICDLLKKEGFNIISVKDFLPNLVLKTGIYSAKKPSDSDLKDIDRGRNILENLSKSDVGQACIIQEGLVLGVEAIEGTKNLLSRCENLKINKNGGVLVKTAKTKQTTLADLPTIGPETIQSLHNGNYAGVAISANTTQVIHFDEVVKLCNRYGLFFTVI